MPLDKKSALKKTYDRFMEICIKSMDEGDLDKFAMPDIMGYGTAQDEVIFGIEALKGLLIKQREQSSGLELKYKISPVFKKINEQESAAIIVDELHLNMHNADINHDLSLRITTCLEYLDHQWKVVHWHGSIPQGSTSEDTWHIDEWKRKTEELQKLVDQKTSQLIEQNNELEIEAALERVRTTAMAMQKPEDLSIICEKIFIEMKGLGFDDLRNTEIILNQDEKENIRSYYYSDYGVTGVVDVDCKSHPLILKWFHDLQKQEDAFAEVTISKDQMEEWEEYRKSLNYVPDPKLSEVDQVFYYSYSTGSGALSISSFTSLSKVDIEVLKRFRNVFTLAYQRYTDIQQAEQQAREAQIEASLERIRARSMAMHSSDELGEVAKVMFDQMQMLGGDLYAFGVVLCDKYEDTVEQWHGLRDAGMMSPIQVPIDLDFIHRYRYDQWKAGVELFSIEIPSDYINKHFELMFELPSLKVAAEDLASKGIELTIPSWEIDYGASFSNGYLLISSLQPFEEDHIFPRFAKVFEQAYTRFLDLKKAEAQAREAQIEAALERVRSRTMAMQHSSELGDVANVLFEHLNQLVSDLWTCGFVLCEKNRNEDEWWLGMEEGFTRGFFLPNVGDYAHATLYEGWVKKDEFRTVQLEGETLQEHYDWLMGIEVSRKIFEEMDAAGIARPEWQKLHAAYFSKGYLCIITQVPCQEEDIFKRFAQVFDLTYTRFLDLKKAEAQAQEAQIELSLEKIRAQVTSMQESSDLFDIVVSMRNEFIALGHEADYFWHMRWSEDSYDMSMTSTEGDRLGMVITVPKFVHEQIDRLHKWEKSNHPYIVLDLDAEGAWDYLEKMNTYGHYEQMDPHAPGEEDIHHIGGLTFIIARTTHGEIGFSLPGKVPDPPQESIDTLVRFAGVFDLAYRRFEDLKATELQHREAQIELALERVRARTMAMQKSEELPDVANVLFLQVQSLGIPAWSAGYNILSDDKKVSTCIMSSEGQVQAAFQLPLTVEKSFVEWHKAVLNEDEFFVQELGGKALEEHYKYLMSLPGIQDAVDPLEEAGISLPTFQVNHLSHFKQGFLLFITYEQVPDAHEIFKRFTQVFEQTYTRFLDLKKAEAQAREAQVETALEKVRSRSMGMQSSEELKDVIKVIFNQLALLDINAEHAGIVVDYKPKEDWTFWVAETQDIPSQINVPYLDALWDRQYTEAKEKGLDFFTTQLNFEEKNKFYKNLLEHIPALTEEARDFYFSCDGLAISTAIEKDVGLYIENFSGTPYSDEENLILKRCVKVFQQTYTRFLDLKRAEEQAWEAQINLALERVRARTMAMHKSEELADISFELFKQVQSLGVKTWHCAFNIYDEDQESSTEWGTNEGGVYPKYKTPREGIFKKYYEIGKSGESLHIEVIGEDKSEAHYEWLCSLPGVGEQLIKLRDAGVAFPKSQIDHVAYFKYGYLIFITYEPVPDAHEIFKRFANIFEQSYVRFLDLKKAEKQTREAKIETALERVRARAMAMQEPEELKDVAQVLRGEMGNLEIEELETCSIYIKDQDSSKADCWYAIKDIREDETILVKDQITLDLNETWVGKKMLSFYDSKEERASIVMKGDNRKEWIEYCEEQSTVLEKYYGEIIPERTYHLYKFSNGSIGFASAGDISEESWNILTRAASAFSLAYSRFQDLTRARKDLIKLKEEKKRAEDALSDLKEAQVQLIHAEKMASLGELTAGIAHEIQNPLNFVNNFSEVSGEMIEEVHEEIEGGDLDEAKEILQDLKGNLEKINHHGQRASGIVKSMLDHSRTTSGEKVETDINALCDEYLRLAYHGMRAKDRSFNADFKLNLDPDLPKIKVIPQDIGRVLLNLINNAFQACADQSVSTVTDLQGFENLEGQGPKVEVTTKNLGDAIEISVSDNGPGIPDDIKDKIFQPFFTTKPTGQGTGLGLSLSYDIIKAHNGNIQLHSAKGQGTTFLVEIPY